MPIRRMHRTDMKSSSNKGFTVIEVMIVLAIAGLIMVIVLIAIPQLQRNSRDLSRKRFVEYVYSELNNFFTNNQKYPETATEKSNFIDNYIQNQADPGDGLPYEFWYRGCCDSHSDIPDTGEVFIQTGHWCALRGNVSILGDPITGTHAQPSRFVIWTGTEGGSFYCLDNFDTATDP